MGFCDLKVSKNGLSSTSHIRFVLVELVLCYTRIKAEYQENISLFIADLASYKIISLALANTKIQYKQINHDADNMDNNK